MSGSTGSAALARTLLVAVALVGCGDGDRSADGPPRPDVRRVRLEPLVPPPQEQSERVVARIELPEELATWTIEGGRGAVEPVDGRRALRLFGGDGMRVVVPGPIEAGGCDGLALELAAPAGSTVTAHLVREGGKALSTRPVSFGGGNEPQRVALELKRVLEPGFVLERLLLVFHGAAAPWIAGPIELTRIPPAARVSDPSDADPLVEAGGVHRRGYGIAPERPLEGTVSLPRDAVLRFAHAPAPRVDLAIAARSRIVARVESAGGELVEAEFPAGGGPGWRGEELSLAALGPGEARVRIELVAPEGAEVVCYLSDPRVLRPDPRAASVLLVTSDTHRADHLGAAPGAAAVRTPALDALARRGVLFEDCFSSTNVTNPSHIALMTGVHPREVGILGNETALSDEARTLAERFADAGYACLASLSVRHLAPPTSGLGQGFHCASYPIGEREAADTVGDALRFLSERAGEPTFLWVHLFDAHEPYEPPPDYAKEYYPGDRDPFDPAAPPLQLSDEVLGRFAGLRDLDYPVAMYRGEVASLDAELSRLLDLPRFREGIVAVTADHGESLGEHGIYFGHAELYPQTIHVPLILAWPGGPSGARVRVPVSQIDLGRTLVELAGVEAPDFPGRSLLGAVRGEAAGDEPRYTLAANYTSAAITVGGWHLILGLRGYRPKGGLVEYEGHRVELYHMAEDPACEVDLVDREPERARRLRARLIDWLLGATSGSLAGTTDDSAEMREHLAGLGYVEAGDGRDVLDYFDPDCDCRWCERFR